MAECDNPPCAAVGPFRYCPIKGCGWMEGPPQECWTCGAALSEEHWRSSAREPSNENKRWCIDCHDRIEFSRDPLAIGNMLRHVGGLPPVVTLDSSDTPQGRAS